jgi:glycosyltransferase involved in cell wall biosynthesis
LAPETRYAHEPSGISERETWLTRRWEREKALRVIVSVESRYTRTPDGAVWTRDGLGASFFARYRSAFDRVRVVARVADIAVAAPDSRRVDGDEIEVWPIPYYIGAGQYLRRRAAVVAAIRSAASHHDAVIVRAPSPIGTHLATVRRGAALAYAAEVIGDPRNVFAAGAVNHPLRPLLRRQQTTALQRLCRDAAAVAYVTDSYLQTHYPAGSSAVAASYSSVELPPDAYVPEPRSAGRRNSVPMLVSVGTLEQPYKGIDILLKALHQLHAMGVPAQLVHIGDGRLRPQLEQLAAELGLTKHVRFAGMLAVGDAVRRRLDDADLLVMPSLTEGLPRALIEGMARGLPAVGTVVGGVPELLAPADLVAPGDVAGLAGLIRDHLADSGRMAAASARNLARSRDFSAERLMTRRAEFYRAVREITAAR